MTTPFETNFTIWSRIFPAGAQCFESSLAQQPEPFLPCDKNELSDWLNSLHLPQYNMLVVLGIDDGSIYELVKPWLDNNPKHVAIFAENNAAALRQFLSTERAAKLLKDDQAWLLFGNTPEEISNPLFNIFQTYPFQNPVFSYLPNKNLAFAQRFTALSRLVWLNARDNANEYHHASKGFTDNLYKNFYLLPESKDFRPFLDSFKNTPAIIAGAGPSLAKNRHLLQNLKDNALIIGGGTAINALNAGSIDPHIGIGIDPNHQFYNRILSSTSWEIPFVYYYRMYHKALSLVHGNKLFLKFSPGVTIDNWFHEQLGVRFTAPYKKEFMNVINLAAYMALSFGCDPIIFVGIDLAYTDERSYADGLNSIAAQNAATELRSKHPSEQIIIRKDIYGQPIKTLWKWVMESLWYSKLAKENPNARFINCTEGGLGFQGIPNATLAEAISKYCNKDLGIQQKVQDTYDRCPWCAFTTPEEISGILQSFQESLARSESIVQEELAALQNPKNNLWEKSDLYFSHKLKQEPAFNHLLHPFDNYIQSRIALPFRKLDAIKGLITPDKYSEEKIEAQKSRCKRFIAVLKDNLQAVQEAITEPHLPPLFPLKTPPPQPEHDGHALKTYYPNGVIKSIIPAKNGVLDGEVLLYYHNGSLSRRLHFTNGVKDGSEEIWDRNGQLLVKDEYKQGKPVGTALEWHSNGQLARETTYGPEGGVVSAQAWDKHGKPIAETRHDVDSFLGEVQNQTKYLGDTLKSILLNIREIGISNLDLEQEIHVQLSRLQQLDNKITPARIVHSKDTNEPLWTTPASTEDIQWELSQITEATTAALAKVEIWIRKTLASGHE